MSIEWQSISAGEERDPVSATLLSPPARSLTWLLALIFLNIFLFKFSPGTLNHTLNRGDVCRDHRSWKILPGVVILFRKNTKYMLLLNKTSAISKPIAPFFTNKKCHQSLLFSHNFP